MRGALVLLMYPNSRGDNTTFSPRLSTGNTEPEFYPDLHVDSLPGTGFDEGTGVYTLAAVCRNCRIWPEGGRIDVESSAQKCIFAAGPVGFDGSDDVRAPLRYHAEYGSFTINLVAASGSSTGAAPAISVANATTDGAALLRAASGKRDWASTLHAILMIWAFFAIMPLGFLILRMGQKVSWHGISQGAAFVVVLVGVGLGFYISTLYNRSKSFNHPHQILGMVVLGFLVIKSGLGYFHQRRDDPKFAPYHVWIGRLVIVVGIINGFMGFPFALAPRYNYILAGLVLALVPLVCCLLAWKVVFRKRGNRLGPASANPGQQEGAPPGYDPEPWRRSEHGGTSGDDLSYAGTYQPPPPRYYREGGGDSFLGAGGDITLHQLDPKAISLQERTVYHIEEGSGTSSGREQVPHQYL
ncbi:hypothetical protein VTK73DRAFT_3940 [Phialemonium thermophilum]|uniref:Cytochrome b561 domain-containing protein n=1 Tax=Phialemonium thermophilum TaxID=223376 RepID=A0ABR3Y0J4_9PEZI